MTLALEVDQQRLTADLDELAAISSEPAPVVTRVVFTAADQSARQLVKRWCSEAGSRCSRGSCRQHLRAMAWSGRPLSAGGHRLAHRRDPNAGRYDGTVGVLGGLEAIRTLVRAGFKPTRSVELILFTSEEPTRFGIGCLGSRMLAGTVDASAGEALKDRDGATLNQARTQAGFRGELAAVPLDPGYYSAFVELHIEQGPLLEQHSNDIGVVTAIAAPASVRISFQGEGGHAGAVLMPDRRDAFLAAAEWRWW